MSEKKLTTLFICTLALFVLLRIPGLGMPFHQDEWKNVYSAEVGASGTSNLLHPPLTGLLMSFGVNTFGGSHMRILVLLFAVASAILLFDIVRKRTGKKAALMSLFLYSISFYGVWSSLMIDTDGAILPALFLLCIFCYDRARSAIGKQRLLWYGATVLVSLTGLMIKLSFILVIGTLVVDFLIENKNLITKKTLTYGAVVCGVCVVLFTVAILIAPHVYPGFNLHGMVMHAESFAHISGRNYTQVAAEGVKAVLYLSPLLIVPLIFLRKKPLREMRIFVVYVVLGLLFYFVIFDFSRGALDKYLMFLVIPLSALSGAIFSELFSNGIHLKNRSQLFFTILGTLMGGALFALQLLPHAVPALYPKGEWFSRVFNIKWDMLMPFTGGSGPIGFYVSFLLISVAFIVSFTLIALALLRPSLRKGALIACAIVGLVYNIAFWEEFSFGIINGNSSTALASSLSYLEQNHSIKGVITYNDSGAYELSHAGKYVGRFYAVPEFQADNKIKFANNRGGNYLIVDVPHINDASFYGTFLSKCAILFETRSGEITGRIYSCNQKK